MESVTSGTARLRELRDDALPAMPALLGEEAEEMLAAAVEPAGLNVTSVRPLQVTWRPGRSLAVTYRARLRATSGDETDEQVVAITGAGIPAGALVVGRDELRVGLWRLTGDPLLPGLRSVSDERSAAALLSSLGVRAEGVKIRLRAYRPTRRAVVELETPAVRLFAKVVPPDQVESLQQRHRVMSEHLPVPHSHGWSKEHGVVVLEEMRGLTLRQCLADARAQLPDPRGFGEMLDRLPDLGDGKCAWSPVAVALEHVSLLELLAPDLRDRLSALAEALGRVRDPESTVPVHGDLHDAQIMVRGGRVSGLLDVDTSALGYRIDDWATMLGHLSVLQAGMSGVVQQRVAEFGRRVLGAAEQEVDARDLRVRVAAVALGMATGPFRAQTEDWPDETRDRIALAEQWMDSVERVSADETPLIAVSGEAHGQR